MIPVAVDHVRERLAAVRTGGVDRYFVEALPQKPLHEGRRDRVLCSSSIQALTRRENQVVFRLLRCHWKRPRHLHPTGSHEEE